MFKGVAELYDDNLSKLNVDDLADNIKLEIFTQILDDIYCLFAKGYYYSDIKPDNILYKCLSDGKIKVVLGDIGSIYYKKKGLLNFFKSDMDALISVKLSEPQHNIIKNINDYAIRVQIYMILGIVELYKFLKFSDNKLNNDILYLNNIKHNDN